MLRSKIFWIAFLLLLLVPMALTFVLANNYIPFLQTALRSLRNRPADLILSDILFYEAGFFLIMGAMVAGAVLYLSWSPGWMALFVDPVFHWRLVKKENEIPAALIIGFMIIAVGIFYISAAIAITL